MLRYSANSYFCNKNALQLNFNIELKDIETMLKQLAVSDLKKLNESIRHEII